MASLRQLSFAALGLGLILLIAGFAFGSDLLGFLFMVCLVAAVVLFGTDLVLRRRTA